MYLWILLFLLNILVILTILYIDKITAYLYIVLKKIKNFLKG